MAEGTGRSLDYKALRGQWAWETSTLRLRLYLRMPGTLSAPWLSQGLPVSLQSWKLGSSR